MATQVIMLLLFVLITFSTAMRIPSLPPYGINCQGGLMCSSFWGGRAHIDQAQQLACYINGTKGNGAPDDRFYKNGEKIACIHEWRGDYRGGAICAFFQAVPGNKNDVHGNNKGGAYGKDAKRLIHEFLEHECNRCGSVPFNFPRSNRVYDGMFTLNWVHDGCWKTGRINGLCPISEEEYNAVIKEGKKDKDGNGLPDHDITDMPGYDGSYQYDGYGYDHGKMYDTGGNDITSSPRLRIV